MWAEIHFCCLFIYFLIHPSVFFHPPSFPRKKPKACQSTNLGATIIHTYTYTWLHFKFHNRVLWSELENCWCQLLSCTVCCHYTEFSLVYKALSHSSAFTLIIWTMNNNLGDLCSFSESLISEKHFQIHHSNPWFGDGTFGHPFHLGQEGCQRPAHRSESYSFLIREILRHVILLGRSKLHDIFGYHQ